MNPFRYCSGELIAVGDEVTAAGMAAEVEAVYESGSQDAKDYSCFETGGIALRFLVGGDLQIWPFVNEDLLLERRADR